MSGARGTFLWPATDSAGQTRAITGLGFSPDVVILWGGRDEAVDTLGRVETRIQFGVFASATSRWCMSSYAADAQPSTFVGRASRNDAIACLGHPNGSLTYLLDVQSIDADGFTVIVDQAGGANERFHFLAFGGLNNASTGTIQEPGATGNQATTGLGFQPDAVLFGSIGVNVINHNAGATAHMMLGAALSSTRRFVTLVESEDAADPSDAQRYQFDGECIALGPDLVATTLDARADFVSLDADGFTINWLERASNRYVFYLAMKGGNWELGDFTTLNTLNQNHVEGGFFSPDGVLCVSHGKAKDTQDTPVLSSFLSIGAATSSTDRAAIHSFDIAGQADTRTGTGVQFDEVIVISNGASSPAWTVEVDVKSFDSDGITFIEDLASPTCHIWYLAWKEVSTDTRARLVKYTHNSDMSLDRGRPYILDIQGRDVPVEQLRQDNWMYADGPSFPTPMKYQSLLEDPATFFVESVRIDPLGEPQIETVKEGMLQQLLRRL